MQNQLRELDKNELNSLVGGGIGGAVAGGTANGLKGAFSSYLDGGSRQDIVNAAGNGFITGFFVGLILPEP